MKDYSQLRDQFVIIGPLAPGNFVSFFAKQLVGNGSFTLSVQHSKVDLPLYGDGNCPHRNVDHSHADAAGPRWMARYGFYGFFFSAASFHFFRRL